MGIKYYYSAPMQVRQFTAITDVNGDVFYTYPESKLITNLPRVTICSILDGNSVRFGYATCSSRDSFKKRIGQNISRNRAIKCPFKVVELTDIKDIHNISDKVIEEIFELETKRIYQ